ncbi:hypothetical protein [Nitrobacter vulgaris]|uniref:Uncharacterized protein n=1 Tax=Nitrobacter vulgaris TaxID=29421 RepID=A0A1V4HZW4_NITVU|nr:hypothetical protein [Nitrobacter vulgaris]OPH83130.1 hypothetical protein B2M20_09135 [Nitrobacter vulgaris]
MSITEDATAKIEQLSKRLISMSAADIAGMIDSGDTLNDVTFRLWREEDFGAFYAPFDWVNEQADIVLIGITPGRRQAKDALLALRAALMAGKPIPEAAAQAKQAASFNGDMRSIATELMDHFRLNEVFGLRGCSLLFDVAASRAHYTSVLRYPVIEWKTVTKKGMKTTKWTDYGGDDQIIRRICMKKTIETKFLPELREFANAWLVPFGPIPALVLEQLADRGEIDRSRILTGLNHPSGTQWNRHNCQLDRVDHRACARNVGCSTIQDRSRRLRQRIREILSIDGQAERTVS